MNKETSCCEKCINAEVEAGAPLEFNCKYLGDCHCHVKATHEIAGWEEQFHAQFGDLHESDYLAWKQLQTFIASLLKDQQEENIRVLEGMKRKTVHSEDPDHYYNGALDNAIEKFRARGDYSKK